jgi:hypothetical protein
MYANDSAPFHLPSVSNISGQASQPVKLHQYPFRGGRVSKAWMPSAKSKAPPSPFRSPRCPASIWRTVEVFSLSESWLRTVVPVLVDRLAIRAPQRPASSRGQSGSRTCAASLISDRWNGRRNNQRQAMEGTVPTHSFALLGLLPSGSADLIESVSHLGRRCRSEWTACTVSFQLESTGLKGGGLDGRVQGWRDQGSALVALKAGRWYGMPDTQASQALHLCCQSWSRRQTYHCCCMRNSITFHIQVRNNGNGHRRTTAAHDAQA